MSSNDGKRKSNTYFWQAYLNVTATLALQSRTLLIQSLSVFEIMLSASITEIKEASGSKTLTTHPMTPLRKALYNLDLLLSPPPIGLGYKTLSRPTSGHVLVHWVLNTAKLCESSSEALNVLEDMERVGGLDCVRGVGEDGQFVHVGAKNVKEMGVLNMYLKKGVGGGMGMHGMSGSGSTSGLGTCKMVVGGVDVDEARGLIDMEKKRIVEGLNDAWKGLCEDCLKRDGHEVVYALIRDSKWWPMALEMVHRIGEIDDIGELRNEIGDGGWKALCFNLYNLLVWHGKLVLGSPTSLASRGKFFDGAKYWMGGSNGGVAISLSKWEHGVLRRQWATESGHKRLLVLKAKDPRMHFILNCGAQSCPPIVPLSLLNSEEQIEDNTRTFIQKNCIVDAAQSTVTLSRLWKWFRVDFTPEVKTTLALLRWIQDHAPDDKRKDLEQLCSRLSNGGEVELKFMRYNWADNGDWDAKPDDHLMHIYDLSFKRNE